MAHRASATPMRPCFLVPGDHMTVFPSSHHRCVATDGILTRAVRARRARHPCLVSHKRAQEKAVVARCAKAPKLLEDVSALWLPCEPRRPTSER
jgi:hypothetical protein